MVDVHARLIRHLEQARRARPRDRVPAHGRRDRRAQGSPPGARGAGARGGDGVLQDPPVPAAARVRPARGPLPRARSGALLPAAAARALRRTDAGAPAAPRDHRDRRREPARRPRRHDVRRSGSARRPVRRRRCSPAGMRPRARSSTCARSGPRSRSSTTRSTAQTQLGMLIEGRRLVERADTLAGHPYPDQIDIARAIGRFEPGGADAGGGAPGRARRAPTALAFDDVRRARAGRRSAAVRRAGRRDAVDDRPVRHRRGRRGDQQRVSGCVCGLLRARLAARAQLAARPDHRASAREPWQALARAAMRDDLFSLHRALTREVLEAGGSAAIARRRSPPGERNQDTLERCLGMLADVSASGSTT